MAQFIWLMLFQLDGCVSNWTFYTSCHSWVLSADMQHTQSHRQTDRQLQTRQTKRRCWRRDRFKNDGSG